jgi:hypothetical protein
VEKVKIFKFNKEANYKEDSLAEVKIVMDKGVKNVGITNPVDSNRIYIIDKIALHNCNYNEIKFYSYEDLRSTIEDSKCGFLEIKAKAQEVVNEEKLLLFKTKAEQNCNCNLINKQYFIMLPGGTLFISFLKAEKNAWLKLVVGEELL